jgi:hypothetical protein
MYKILGYHTMNRLASAGQADHASRQGGQACQQASLCVVSSWSLLNFLHYRFGIWGPLAVT